MSASGTGCSPPAVTSGSVRWERDALLASPAFESLWPVIALCPADRFPGAAELTELANARGVVSGGGVMLRFVSEADSVPGAVERQYEVRIYREGEVPTRTGNAHDLFNALAWLAFPRTKALMNRRHYEALMERRNPVGQEIRSDTESCGTPHGDIGSRGTPRGDIGSRGTPRDVLTLFDESGVIVASSEPELERLLRGFEWKKLFWERRSGVRAAMRFFLFGHGIHEKALRPFKGLTAKALILRVSCGFHDKPLDQQLAEADSQAEAYFAQPFALASTRTLAPLPVLGVPGWEAANERASFYEDTSVFRPGRSGYPG